MVRVARRIRMNAAGIIRPAQPSAPHQIATIIVDVQEGAKEVLTYSYGTVEEGIMRIAKLIATARKSGSLVVLVKNESLGRVLEPIAGAAGTDALVIPKRYWDSFRGTDLAEILFGRRIVMGVVGGFNRVACVLHTAETAVRLGFRVATSDEIMFGHAMWDHIRSDRRMARSFYAGRTDNYRTADELAASVYGRPLGEA